MPTMKGRVFDQLAAVSASVMIASSSSSGTGWFKKSRVDRRDAMNAETAAASRFGFGLIAQIYPQIRKIS
jgi:uncharacterized membrane protein YfcA